MSDAPPPLTILYENQHWLALNKIPKLSVERSPYGEPTIESLVYDYLAKSYRNPYVGIVHRLDRVTTGVLLFAKRKSALRALNTQFRERQVRKTYWAIVEKPLPQEAGRLANYLTKDRARRMGLVVDKKVKGAIRCQLDYRQLVQNKVGCLLEVRPLSGKFHQIRVQLAHLGYPILGDRKYGSTIELTPHVIALHAARLALTNPTNQEEMIITAPVPETAWWGSFAENLPNFDINLSQ